MYKGFMRKIVILLLLFPLYVHAAFNKPTAHSRANCAGFNESVTWHAFHSYWWRVESHHYINKYQYQPAHILNTGTAFTWRAAAFHATEAYSSRGDRWFVQGFHFYHPPDGLPTDIERIDVITTAEDCNIYDGWWDIN